MAFIVVSIHGPLSFKDPVYESVAYVCVIDHKDWTMGYTEMSRSALQRISYLHYQLPSPLHYTAPLPSNLDSSSALCWHAKNLGIGWAGKDPCGGAVIAWQKKDAFLGRIWRSLQNGMVLLCRCDAIGLQMQPSKDASPQLGHSLFMATPSCTQKKKVMPQITGESCWIFIFSGKVTQSM